MIKKYKEFINELYTIDQRDPTELASDKTYFNKAESDIKEFLNKKTTLDNIYITYKDEKDLIAKLAAQKFIPVNTGDKKKIMFTNPLIGLYADAAEKKRELRSIEDELTTQTNSLNQTKIAITQNPDAAESLKDDESHTQSKISDLNTRISQLKSDITTLERNSRDKLKEMKNGLVNNKKKLDYFIKSPNTQ